MISAIYRLLMNQLAGRKICLSELAIVYARCCNYKDRHALYFEGFTNHEPKNDSHDMKEQPSKANSTNDVMWLVEFGLEGCTYFY